MYNTSVSRSTCKRGVPRASQCHPPWRPSTQQQTRGRRCFTRAPEHGEDSATFNLELNNYSYDFGFDFDSSYMLTRRKQPIRVLDVKYLSSISSVTSFCDYQHAVSQPDDEIDLIHCGTMIARLAHPTASEDGCRLLISDIAAAAEAKLQGATADPARKLQALNHAMYAAYKLDGAEENLYHPESNYLDTVLQYRQGTPATLALIYMEAAKQLGVPTAPLILPSHTFVMPLAPGCGFAIDPYNNGQTCSLQRVAQRLSLNFGFQTPLIELDPSWEDNPPKYTRKDLLYRILTNLRECYWGPVMRGTLMVDDVEAAQKQLEAALVVTRYLRATEPAMPSQLRDQGYILAALGRGEEAAGALREYLEEAGDAEDRSEVEGFVQELKRKGGR